MPSLNVNTSLLAPCKVVHDVNSRNSGTQISCSHCLCVRPVVQVHSNAQTKQQTEQSQLAVFGEPRHLVDQPLKLKIAVSIIVAFSN